LPLGAGLIFSEELAGRVLPFDSAAAREYAQIAAARRRAGRPIAEADAQIAAIARSRDAAVATRNSAGFADCGLMVINPWEA
jgi:predicted nucleic acid-binding protein